MSGDNRRVLLDFGKLQLHAEIFPGPVGDRFLEALPCGITLQHWGEESYGSIGVDLGENNPLPEILPGGLAYTERGRYLCIFYGQRPAWPVEYIGRIMDDWRVLRDNRFPAVTVRRAVTGGSPQGEDFFPAKSP